MSIKPAAVLKITPLFANLTNGRLQALTARTSRKRFQQGERLIAEGDPCTSLFLVASGKIRIFKLSASEREQVLAIEGFSSSFAELPIFGGGNYPAAASALEDVEVPFISPTDVPGLTLVSVDCTIRVSSEIIAYPGYAEWAWSALPISALSELAGLTTVAINILDRLILEPSHAQKQPLIMGVPVNIS